LYAARVRDTLLAAMHGARARHRFRLFFLERGASGVEESA